MRSLVQRVLPARAKRWLKRYTGQPVDVAAMRAAADPTYEAIDRLVGPGDCVFDVGANIGFTAVLAASCAGAAGRVFAFEPHPEIFRILARTLRLNGSATCTPVNVAVTEADGGTVLLHSDDRPEWYGVASSLISAWEPENKGSTFRVDAVSIDAFCERAKAAPSFIKIDAEGAEALVLGGAAQTLASHRPVVAFETQHGRYPAGLVANPFDVLLSHRYVFVAPSPWRPFDIRAVDRSALVFECIVAVPEERADCLPRLIRS
jgi:FkbM family methyltransferase